MMLLLIGGALAWIGLTVLFAVALCRAAATIDPTDDWAGDDFACEHQGRRRPGRRLP